MCCNTFGKDKDPANLATATTDKQRPILLFFYTNGGGGVGGVGEAHHDRPQAPGVARVASRVARITEALISALTGREVTQW